MKGKVIKRHFKAHIECKDIGKLTQMIQILSSKTLLTAIKEKLPKNPSFTISSKIIFIYSTMQEQRLLPLTNVCISICFY